MKFGCRRERVIAVLFLAVTLAKPFDYSLNPLDVVVCRNDETDNRFVKILTKYADSLTVIYRFGKFGKRRKPRRYSPVVGVEIEKITEISGVVTLDFYRSVRFGYDGFVAERKDFVAVFRKFF